MIINLERAVVGAVPRNNSHATKFPSPCITSATVGPISVFCWLPPPIGPQLITKYPGFSVVPRGITGWACGTSYRYQPPNGVGVQAALPLAVRMARVPLSKRWSILPELTGLALLVLLAQAACPFVLSER